MVRSSWIVLTLTFGVATLVSPAWGQVDARLLARARGASPGIVSTLVELPGGAPAPPGMLAVAPGFAQFRGSYSEIASLGDAHPDWKLSWGPPRRLLIDWASEVVHATGAHALTGLTGKGVVVGIVDTGFDPKHPDLREAGGKTRVAWSLDLSRQPVGRHPELEAEYGCVGSLNGSCAILDAADLDEFLASDSMMLPHDTLGHGTHVASLATGNGLAETPPRFVGIAPGATIIAARVTRTGDGSIQDADVLLATKFVFDRAAELGMPAIVNLSLGSDFGAHDGSAPLEQGLASFVGPAHPGRAIVVAAGNSGGVYKGIASGYPDPFGVYTEVHVPRASSVRVPIISPNPGKSTTHATIYVFIAGRPGDALEVGVDKPDGEWVSPLAPGDGATFKDGALEATIINQTSGKDSPLAPGENGAVVILEGTWRSGDTYAIRLEGHGTARLWVQSEGDLLPGVGNPGALFPRASKEGTIGIPASSPDLLAVGATLDRVTWYDRKGRKIGIDHLGATEAPKRDSSVYFSGAGPNSNAQMKPDIVAPGAFVIGAMSTLADPEKNGGAGIFAAGSACGDNVGCLVVDDFHALSSGTSMSAPIVSGAIALLLEHDASLNQGQIRTLLQAGAQKLEGDVPLEQQVGPGELDVIGTLAVMDAETSPLHVLPVASASWLALTASYAHPDPEWPLVGLVELRSSDAGIADGFDPKRLRLELREASAVEPLVRVAPGLWRFAIVAPAGSGGGELSLKVFFDDGLLLERSVPIAVDRWLVGGEVDARGGCTLSRGGARAAIVAFALLFSIVPWRRRNTRKQKCNPR